MSQSPKAIKGQDVQDLLKKTLAVLEQEKAMFSDLFSPNKSKTATQFYVALSKCEQEILLRIAKTVEALIGAA